jgi:hypothetical protein
LGTGDREGEAMAIELKPSGIMSAGNGTATSKETVSFDLQDRLRDGVSLTGTPTITATPDGLTLSNKVIPAAIINVNAREVPIGTGVQLFIDASAAQAKTYTLSIQVATNASPPDGLYFTWQLILL